MDELQKCMYNYKKSQFKRSTLLNKTRCELVRMLADQKYSVDHRVSLMLHDQCQKVMLPHVLLWPRSFNKTDLKDLVPKNKFCTIGELIKKQEVENKVSEKAMIQLKKVFLDHRTHKLMFVSRV